MADYYSILGLTKNATDIEIKTAFRKLAKIYHPDKNPNNPDSRGLFEQILKAYETLINPTRRRRYDSSIFGTTPQHTQTHHHKHKHQKEWTFTDEDLKRRQYYQNYYKAKQKTVVETSAKNYTDYKYILFATPLAVALLMLIISMFTSTPKNESALKTITESKNQNNHITVLTNGAQPYSGYFGNSKTFDTQNTIHINNSTNYDVVIALFGTTNNDYLQHTYLQNQTGAEFAMLPDSGVYWKILIGKNWDNSKLMYSDKVNGCFDSIVQIQNWKHDPVIFNTNNPPQLFILNVIDPESGNKRYISNATEFFEK